MKINKDSAMKIWNEYFGNKKYATDFHGNYMCRNAYGKRDYFEYDSDGNKVYCGWNIHHILPKAVGGTDAINNLLPVNIYTNDIAEDKTTFNIDGICYQVKKIYGKHEYDIYRIS